MYLRTMPRVLSACLAALCLLGGINCRAAEAPQTSAESFVLMEAQSGRVLASQNAERELAIASTTKIMTALVAMEEKSLSETLSVKEKHLKEGSSMYLRAGETLTLEDLLYGLLLPSGNDAAECIADYCGGGVEPFVRKMNEKAAALGMAHTAFANPSGLDAEGHYSCALDMARLAAYAMCQPLFVRIASTKTAAVGERMLGNHNKLLASLSGCVGVKTGYTSAAGRTLVTCCERDGLRLIAVTLNDRDDWNDHAALYEYGFSAYARRCAVSRGERYAVVPLRGGTQTSVTLAAGEDFFYPATAEEELTASVQLPDGALTAPLEAGQSVGELLVTLDGQEVGRVPLVCAESIGAAQTKKNGLLGYLSALLSA